jgi:hypothetical protein
VTIEITTMSSRKDAPDDSLAGGTVEWFRVERRIDRHPLMELSCIAAHVVRREIEDGTIPSHVQRDGDGNAVHDANGRAVLVVYRDDIVRRLERVPLPQHTARYSVAPKRTPRAEDYDEEDL